MFWSEENVNINQVLMILWWTIANFSQVREVCVRFRRSLPARVRCLQPGVHRTLTMTKTMQRLASKASLVSLRRYRSTCTRAAESLQPRRQRISWNSTSPAACQRQLAEVNTQYALGQPQLDSTPPAQPLAGSRHFWRNHFRCNHFRHSQPLPVMDSQQ